MQAVAQANPNRPRYTNESGQPAEGGETSTDDEETRASSRQALRGERGWRASKEQPRTWETRQHERGETGRHNGTSFLAGVGEAHSSEEAG